MASSSSEPKTTVLKVVLLGNSSVGKSSIMNRFVNGAFDERYYCTLGVDFLSKDLNLYGKKYLFQIWDTAGQERFKSLRTPFYRGADICFLTYGVNSRVSFDNLLMWKSEFHRYGKIGPTDPFPFVVIGNKCDLPDEERQVTFEEAETWCEENGFPYIETSAKDGIKIEETFHLAIKCYHTVDVHQIEVEEGSVNLNSEIKKQICC